MPPVLFPLTSERFALRAEEKRAKTTAHAIVCNRQPSIELVLKEGDQPTLRRKRQFLPLE